MTTSRVSRPRARRLAVAALIVALFAVAGAVGGRLAAAPAQGPAADPNVIVNPVMYQGLRYRSVGPHRGGRVTAISGVRQQPCTFYQGATGGGVWKTTDCGALWTPIGDGQIETGSIGAIAVSESHPDIVWVGTGSAAIRSNVIIGRGVYKSVDAGRTWSLVGLRDGGQIGAVAIHPSNPDIVWVAVGGSPFGPTEMRGIYKTTDGGKTWTRTLFVNRETGARVVAINPSNPDEVYAAMYRGFRKGWDIISGGPASEGGIYKSTDGGVTWAKLSAGLPQRLIGKIDLDVARSKPSIVYAMVEAPGPEGGLYRSDDSGATWTLVNNSMRLRARPFYFHYVDVNPKDENEVWVNELGLWKSTDGGKTFAGIPTPHGDNHGIWFNPDNPETAIQCNDGGANVTRDGGRTWSSILNQPTGEFYMVAVDDQFPYRLYGPQQDNSTMVRAEPAARRVGPRLAAADLGPGVGMRDGPGLAAARRLGRLGRVQGRGGPLRRGDRPGAALLGLPAEPVRPQPEGHQVPLPEADRRLPLAARSEDRLPGVARAAPVDRRRRHLGDHQPRPDGLRARQAGDAGDPDHARHHGRGGLQQHLRDGGVAPREGRAVGRRERRPGARLA